jgi:hypothetical protein
VAYQLDQDAGRAWRIALPALRTPWSDAALRTDGGAIVQLTHWAWREPVDAAPARLAATPPPSFAVAREADGLTVTVKPPPGTRSLMLQFAPDTAAQLVGAGDAAADLALPARRWTRIIWSAPPAEGLRLRLRAAPSGALQLRYAATLDGWPAGVAPPAPPPPQVMALESSGEEVATGSRRLAW